MIEGVLIFGIGALCGLFVGFLSGEGIGSYFNYKLELAKLKAEEEKKQRSGKNDD